MNPPKTSNSYKNAIRNEYEKKKDTLYDGQLISPSTGTLQQLILICYEKSTTQDKDIFQRFFDLKPEKDSYKQIEESDLDKLRPLRSFLMGVTDTRSINILELAAILIDFKPRPYGKYFNQESMSESELKNEEKEKEVPPPYNTLTKEKEEIINPPRLHNNFIRRFQYAIRICLLVATSILLYSIFFAECNLMIWKTDHYEKVNCETVDNDSIGKVYIKLNNDLLENMRKVKVDSTTIFFNKDGTPRIWYYKVSDDKLEYFTSPGIHPETDKTLKAITQHMIDKYVLLKKDSI